MRKDRCEDRAPFYDGGVVLSMKVTSAVSASLYLECASSPGVKDLALSKCCRKGVEQWRGGVKGSALS